jgi:hypothetical protein
MDRRQGDEGEGGSPKSSLHLGRLRKQAMNPSIIKVRNCVSLLTVRKSLRDVLEMTN